MIKILDCTLRDGGYVNNWDFGYNNIKKIITNLVNAKIDYIECGFLKSIKYDKNKTLFPDINILHDILPKETASSKFSLMLNYGDLTIDEIPNAVSENIQIRVAFKKHNKDNALELCKKLSQKGYGIFINPMYTNTYNTTELIELLNSVNEIKPQAFTIVDTTGAMKENDILRLFTTTNEILNPDITIGFHSHDNLQLSFSNAQSLLKNCKNRNLIIDSTVFGIGRGAGNLGTELLSRYLNDNYGGQYNLLPILKTIDEQINPIFLKTPWGYSVPYYLAATNSCHPNYATYLSKKTVSVDMINTILKNIPERNKTVYDKDLIDKMYLNYAHQN